MFFNAEYITELLCDYGHKNVPLLPCFLPAIATRDLSLVANAFTNGVTSIKADLQR
ncbi:hypothetical protein RZN25_15815 [Bacillaceae bacterium S4-13-56]